MTGSLDVRVAEIRSGMSRFVPKLSAERKAGDHAVLFFFTTMCVGTLPDSIRRVEYIL